MEKSNKDGKEMFVADPHLTELSESGIGALSCERPVRFLRQAQPFSGPPNRDGPVRLFQESLAQ